MDTVDLIIKFETEECTSFEVVQLFSELIKTGQAWSLQGNYGRTAESLIHAGYVDRDGNILMDEYKHKPDWFNGG